ncbi:MAG: tetratricopeptide repeat protein, partial [Balneolaceae bacterium]|nr:tetratricopeptide repeat protein [Balneolaceae bacterium]
LAAITITSNAQNGMDDEMLDRADSLYHSFQEPEALEAYKTILEQDPNRFTALWRTSFLYSRIGNRLESEERQREYFNRGIELARRALNVDSTDARSNFVMAVAMGRKAIISRVRERVAASRDIKKYAERAIRLDSTHAGAWHVLGRWHHKVANLGFLERAAANTLFGGIPDASEKKAVEAIERAIRLNPKYMLYYYDLARAYRSMGRDEQAIETCEKALGMPPLTPDDPKIREECRELISELQ